MANLLIGRLQKIMQIFKQKLCAERHEKSGQENIESIVVKIKSGMASPQEAHYTKLYFNQ